MISIHHSLQVTPAMEAGISNHVWLLEEIVALLASSSSQMVIKIPRWLLITICLLFLVALSIGSVLWLLFREVVLTESKSPDGGNAIVVKRVGLSGEAAYRCEYYHYQGGKEEGWKSRELISSQLISGESLSGTEAHVTWNDQGAIVSLNDGPQIELRDGYWINPNSPNAQPAGK